MIGESSFPRGGNGGRGGIIDLWSHGGMYQDLASGGRAQGTKTGGNKTVNIRQSKIVWRNGDRGRGDGKEQVAYRSESSVHEKKARTAKRGMGVRRWGTGREIPGRWCPAFRSFIGREEEGTRTARWVRTENLQVTLHL